MSAKDVFSQLTVELQSNQRLRIGLYAILPILLLYGLLLLIDFRDALVDDFESASANVDRFKALANEKEWLDRATQASELKNNLEGMLWSSDSQGLAKADSQAWLEGIANSLSIQELRVLTNQEVTIVDNKLWIVELSVQGRFEPQTYMRLLGQIESNPKMARVVQADFNRESLPFFRITVRTYFLAI